ncbi:MAG: aldo/keto reductase [Candidatus Saccharimonadales bacterium]
MTVPNIKLADGRTIPQLGLGLYQVGDPKELYTSVNTALEVGYRLFDTAQYYMNEQYLGKALKESKQKRSEIFITSKIAVNNFGYKKVLSSTSESLKKLQTDYIDLMLLHFPVSVLRKKSWLALEKLKTDGLLRSIGVSNYTIRHLEEMKKYANEMPVINQVELHLFLQQPELIEYCNQQNIQVEAYSPLARASSMNDPVIKSLANKYSKSYAQIMLRFLIQLGLVVIPKSVTPSRVKENIDVFDFRLSKEDMASLRELDSGLRTCWNPTLVP